MPRLLGTGRGFLARELHAEAASSTSAESAASVPELSGIEVARRAAITAPATARLSVCAARSGERRRTASARARC